MLKLVLFGCDQQGWLPFISVLWGLVLVLAGGLISGCASTDRDLGQRVLASSLQAVGRGFVIRDGIGFALDRPEGKVPVRLVGANAQSVHGSPSREGVHSLYEASSSYFNVLRIWAVGECSRRAPAPWELDFCFRMGPDGWNERAFQKLDELIAVAGSTGMRVILVLSNNWRDWGGVPMYYEWFNLPPTPPGTNTPGPTAEQLQFFFSDLRAEAAFRSLAERLTSRTNSVTQRIYSEDPTIISWELGNELRPTPNAARAAKIWFERNTRWLRAKVPYQMISTGIDTAGFPDGNLSDLWESMASLPEVDYLDLHLYPGTTYRVNPWNWNSLRHRLQTVSTLAHERFHKPVLLTEIGFSAPNAERFQADLPPTQRESQHGLLARAMRVALQEYGFDGALVWLLSSITGAEREFAVDPRRPEFSALFRGPSGMEGLRQQLPPMISPNSQESAAARTP